MVSPMSQAPFANPTDAYKGRNVMRRNFLLGCAALLVFASAGFGAAQNQSSITGTVTASQLASTGMTSVGTWEKKLNCHGEADCARVLVRAGGKYVLVTSRGTYQLNNQVQAAQFAGQAVTVAGNFSNQKKTVDVADMQLYKSSTTSAGVQ